MASWRQVHAFSEPLAQEASHNDHSVTYRPMDPMPVIIWDGQEKRRRIVPMRWGFPHRSNPMRPDPIHVRSETIDEKPTFSEAFREGQRVIVVMRTFNEGLDLPNGKTEQWTIDPGDGIPRGFAFLWRRYDLPSQPMPLYACVMVTVPASKLIEPITDRMPAILEDEDWVKWLGEVPTSPSEAKAALKTMEHVNWRMAKEVKPPKPVKREPWLI